MRFSTVLGFAITSIFGLANLPALPLCDGGQNDRAVGEAAHAPDGRQNGTRNGNAQDPTVAEIEKYRAMIQKVGPEAREGREQAIEALFSMREMKAHEVLQQYVVPGLDPDGVRESVLTRLPRRMGNPRDHVFNQGPSPVLIRQSYVSKLVEHFGHDRKPLTGEKPASTVRLRKLARAALLALVTKDRRAAFQKLMKSRPVVVRRATLRAAGQCQDLDHASLIAEHLDTNELRVAAIAALFDLTYVDFRDRGTFDRWFAKNHNRTYLALAEEAARESKRQRDVRTKAHNAERLATMVKLMDELANSIRPGKWRRIHAEVFPKDAPDTLSEVRQACLQKLRDVFSTSALVVGGPDAGERLVFFDALAQALAADPSAEDHALLLEVASYVCATTESKQRSEQQGRLTKGLDHPSSVVQLGALRGLRRFFSPENRSRVLDIVAKARTDKKPDILAAAVETLKSPNWSAPGPDSPDLQKWAIGLRAILVDDDLSEAVRGEVIDVLCLADAKGKKVEESFDLLLKEVARPSASVTLRLRMMLRLKKLLPISTSDANRRDNAARTYLDCLVALQTDDVDRKIRLAAASMLVVPDKVTKEQQKVLGDTLARAIGARLLDESDEDVFGELVDRLTLKAEIDDSLVSVVNIRLRKALTKLSAKDSTQNLAKRVVSGLFGVAVKKGRATSEWVKTCQSLLTQRDRKTILLILEYHMPGKGAQLDVKPKELQTNIWKLVVQTAALAPKTMSWSAAGNRGEAEMVNRAFEALLQDDSFTKGPDALDSAATRLIYLLCLSAVGTPAALTARAEKWLQPNDKMLAGNDRHEAQLLLASAYLAKGQPMDAWTRSGMQNITGAMLEQRLALQIRIANKLRRDKNVPAAVTLLDDVVQNTKKNAPNYWKRLRNYILVRHESDHKQGSELLNKINAWVASTSPKLTPQEVEEMLLLKRQLKGDPTKPPKRGAKPPK